MPSNLIVLNSQSGFSEFRVTTLLEKINSSFPEVQSLICEDIYFVSFDKKENEIDKRVKQNLLTILNAIAYEDSEEKNKFFLIPRLGTISPWSSKATEILNNSGIDSLSRIEKGLSFSLGTSSQLDEVTLKKIASKIYDRMTQSIILKTGEGQNIFNQFEAIYFFYKIFILKF